VSALGALFVCKAELLVALSPEPIKFADVSAW